MHSKKQINPDDTFYEVLDFLLEINSDLMPDRMKKAFSHREYFTEMKGIKGYDAQGIIVAIMRRLNYKVQFYDAGSPSTDKKDRRRKINNAIDKFEKALYMMYGKFDDIRIPEHAHDIKEQLEELKLSIETKGTYENKMLYDRRPKTIVTLQDLESMYKEIGKIYNIDIPAYRAKQLYNLI